MDTTQLLYRPEEAAQIIRQSRTAVYELMASGEIESIKIGRSRRISRRALEKYVARLEGEAGDAA